MNSTQFQSIKIQMDECAKYSNLITRFIEAVKSGKDKDWCMEHLAKEMKPQTELGIMYCNVLANKIDDEFKEDRQ